MSASLRLFAVSRLGQKFLRPANRLVSSYNTKYLCIEKNTGIREYLHLSGSLYREQWET